MRSCARQDAHSVDLDQTLLDDLDGLQKVGLLDDERGSKTDTK
jgi:hypothetical protein